jgi:uncharacterized membrane protein YjjP (DUF1212 family)
MKMALEAAVLVMQNGGSTVAAERSFTNILKGYDQEEVAAVWRLDFIAATNAAEGQSAVVRPVGPIGVNLARASKVAVLSERVAKGEVLVAALGAELERIKQLPTPYNRWMMLVTAAFTAACFSRFAGGDWGSFGIAFVAGGMGQFVRSLLPARQLGVGSVTLVCGLLSAMIAGIGLRLGLSQVEPATLIASVIYMVPGLPLINGFVDVLSHKYLVVGITRIINAAVLFLILAIALAFAHTVLL